MAIALKPSQAQKPIGPRAPTNKGTGNELVDREIDKLSQATTDAVTKTDEVQGRTIYGVKLLAMTNTQIEHGLGMKPRGFEPSSLSTVAIIFQADPLPDDRIITLKATGDVTFNLKIW